MSAESVDIHVIWHCLASYAMVAEAEGSSTGAKKKVTRSQESMQSKKEQVLYKTRVTLCSFYSVDEAEKLKFSTHAQLAFFLQTGRTNLPLLVCLFCKNIPMITLD